ncbi:MAG TPA: T9SS type A sorting domain-containing protein [bacterium]|nr:T9SS type A sorting domain-containing protein [bacterium]
MKKISVIVSLLIVLLMILSSFAFADVRLYGELTILESFSGSEFLGEVINDTATPVEYVEVTVTSKDSLDKVIDVSFGFCDGYFDGNYVPVGGIVPFKFYGDVTPDVIAKYSIIISYRTISEAPDNYFNVKLNGELNIKESYSGSEFLGEILNDTGTPVEYVQITVTSKDSEGNVIDVSFGFCDGYYDGNYVSVGGIVPFSFYGDVTPDEIASYSTVISYRTTGEAPENYLDVRLNGELNIIESYSGSEYLGEVINDTGTPVEYVQVTVTSKDSEGKIIDVSFGFCDGYNDGNYVPIGGVVPFSFYGDVTPDEIITYSIVISYRVIEISPPTDVKLSDILEDHGHSIKITWTLSIDDEKISHYNIFRSRNPELTEPLSLDSFNSLEELILVEQDSTILIDTVPKGQNSYIDESVPYNGISYYYWLQAVSNNASSEKVAARIVNTEVDDFDNLPSEVTILGNYPNPFNISTVIKFIIPREGFVNFAIYNFTGQKVYSLISKYMSEGMHDTHWNGRNDIGQFVSSGLYIIKIKMGSQVSTHRIMLLK